MLETEVCRGVDALKFSLAADRLKEASRSGVPNILCKALGRELQQQRCCQEPASSDAGRAPNMVCFAQTGNQSQGVRLLA